MGFKSNGNLNKLTENLRGLEAKKEMKLADLMDADFIKANSEYSSLDELVLASGYKVESEEDFGDIPDAEWDVFIEGNTKFESWEDMQRAAFIEHTKKLMFKGLK